MLYFGDDDMTRAAAYLCGIMTRYGIPFERIDSTQSPSDELLQQTRDAFILSDYPRKQFQPGQCEKICAAVKNGAGLAMFGGWESYHGRLGEYHETALAEALPVTMLPTDDRRHFPQGLVLVPTTVSRTHPILDGLPWEKPPVAVGLNEVAAKPDATVLLHALPLAIRANGGGIHDGGMDCSLHENIYPMLVVGRYGKGRTVALATDVAPHWVGGFVDWGETRITQDLPGDGFVEIGSDYAKFFAQLLRWVAGGGDTG